MSKSGRRGRPARLLAILTLLLSAGLAPATATAGAELQGQSTAAGEQEGRAAEADPAVPAGGDTWQALPGGEEQENAAAESPPPAAAAGEEAPPAGRLLTLEECVAIALEKNFGIRQERKAEESARAGFSLAHAERFYPRAWAEFFLPNYAQRTVRDFDPDTGTENFVPSDSTYYDGSVDVELPILTGGSFQLEYGAFQLDQTSGDQDLSTYSNTARLSFLQPLLGDNAPRLAQKKARYALQVAQESLRGRIVTLTYQVSAAYYGLVKAVRSLEIGQSRVRQSESSYEIAQKKQYAGLIPEVEAMQLEVELARSRAELESSVATQRRLEDALKDILGVDLDEALRVVTEVPVTVEEIDRPEAVAHALASRSDIREQQMQIEVARLDLRSTRRLNNPTGSLSLYYEYDGKDEDSFSESIDNRRTNQGASLGINLPLFDMGRNRALVTQGRLSLESLELGLEDLRRRVELEVREAARAVEEARSRYGILEATMRVAQRTYEINLQRFEVGTLTSQDLFQEEVRLNETRLDHLDALIDYNLAWARFLEVVNQ